MNSYIDLERRFLALTADQEVDPDWLASISDHRFGSDVGWPEVLEQSRVVILAEAGSGKTREFRQQAKKLVEDGRVAFFVPLEALASESLESILSPKELAMLDAWKEDGNEAAWFFLDAVDELKLNAGKLDRALQRLANTINGNLGCARVVISCRPYDWRANVDRATMRDRLPSPPQMVEELPPRLSPDEAFLDALRKDRPAPRRVEKERKSLGVSPDGIQVLALLPMSDQQIRRFATQCGVQDPTAFLAEVSRQNAWDFARRPFDLIELVATWLSSGRLGTRMDQHEANIVVKLRDDPDRPDHGALSDSQAYEGAERIALALALTRTRTIRAPDQALDVGRSEGSLDAADILTDWTESQRQALLRRGLFDPATYGRVRFHHRSVQEYLAARRLLHLRQKGMSIKAAFRLLFATCYGEEVVFPSMRAIAAWMSLWDRVVLRELMRREPEVLLSLGDPESLNLSDRAELVRTFAKVYGEGGWRGLHVPVDEVRRLSHPELASVVRELWGDGPRNDDVRDLLIDMIWQGPIDGCVDLAKAAAFDRTWSDGQRAIAVASLVACKATEAVKGRVENLLAHPEAWPAPIVHSIAPELFPDSLSVEQLLILLKRTPEPRSVGNGFSWSLREVAQSVPPEGELASSLRNRVAELIYDSRAPELDFYRIKGSRDYLTPALLIMCERKLQSGSTTDPGLARACVVAARFGEDDRSDAPLGRFREDMANAEALRSELFWADLDLMDALVPTADQWHRYYHVVHESLLGALEERDRPWLELALADSNQHNRRPVALHALVELWRGRGAPQEELARLEQAVGGDMALIAILEERTTARTLDPAFERHQRNQRRRACVREGREAQRLAGWAAWRDRFLEDPSDAFSAENRQVTIANIYKWLSSGDGRNGRYSVWDRNALVQAFGTDATSLTEQAFKEQWRSTTPELWSARAADERNSVPYSWVYGLCGLAAEASSPGWSSTLSSEEARTAVAYAVIEINGFAPFVLDLVESHPAEVDSVLGEELSSQLRASAEYQHLPALQDLSHSQVSVKRLLAPRLVSALEIWPRAEAEDDGRRLAHHLDHVLRILTDVGDDPSSQGLEDVCAIRFESDPFGALALSWLRGLFRLDAVRGAEVLASHLANAVDDASRAHVIAVFGDLFGDRDPVALRVADPDVRAKALGRLVRGAYAFVRREDDQVHDGVYHPDLRDRAETARNFLLSSLIETPGAESRRQLLALANEPDFAHFPDRLRLLARQRAATDAEFDALSPGAVVAIEARFEAPPQDRDGLFAVMMDRLGDLAHDVAHHDFTDRRTLRSIKVEVEMQRTLSIRLQAMANGAYLITREEEVADRKETDIRFLATKRNQKAVAEVKLAGSYSISQLETALRNQLLGQYLRHVDCKAGCLLMTFNGDKTYWEDTATGAHLDFQALVSHLQVLARALEVEAREEVRLAVFGLDLTDPELAPAHR